MGGKEGRLLPIIVNIEESQTEFGRGQHQLCIDQYEMMNT